MSFFVKRNDAFYHNRIEKEIRQAIDKIKKRKENGKKGGIATARANAIARGAANGVAKGVVTLDPSPSPSPSTKILTVERGLGVVLEGVKK